MPQYLFALFFFITSFEMGLFNIFFGNFFHNGLILAIFYVVLCFFFFRILKYRKIINLSALNSKDFKFLSIVSLISVLYFIIHSILIGPFSSIKYAGYLLFLYILVTQTEYKYFKKLCSIYLYFMAYLSGAVLLQTLLLSFLGVPLGDFHSVRFYDINFFRAPDYVMPYFLAYLGVEPGVSFGPLSFHRAMGLSSEPKYFSAMLWIALAISFSSDTNNYRSRTRLLKTFLLVGIFLSHAYSSILLICMMFCFYYILSSSKINTKLKVLMTLFIPIMISIMITFVLELIIGSLGGNAFAQARMESFGYSVGGVDFTSLKRYGLFGTNIKTLEKESISGVTMLLNWVRFGLIGFCVYLLPISFLLYKSYLNFENISSNKKLGFVIFVSTYIVYYQIFFSQPYTLLSCFLLAGLFAFSQNFQSNTNSYIKP